MNIIEIAQDNFAILDLQEDNPLEVHTSTGVVFTGPVYGITDSVVTLNVDNELVYIHIAHIVSVRNKL